MKVWIKIQRVTQGAKEEIVVAICDEELLGKKFGNFKISEHFFKGELVEIETAIKSLENATIANLVGRDIVTKAIEEGIVKKEEIKEINGIPHAQIFTI